MKKVICYIDGYNFYHATKDRPSANIDFRSLASSMLLENQQLEVVHYFSAFATWRSKDHLKHKTYTKELEKVGVTVTMSHFKRKKNKCNFCKARWWSHEEKESDVRLALQILEDAVDNKFDTAFILSGDSDIVPAIEKVKSRYPDKRILVALPKHSLKHARDIKQAAHGFINLSPSRIRKHLL